LYKNIFNNSKIKKEKKDDKYNTYK
jgi:hypothetical protein